MAEIYKVKTVGLAGFEKLQVLKRILPGQAHNPRFIRSFIDEARIAVSLNHRNIVQVFEFGRVATELFLAMELIEGVNLRDATLAALRRRTRPSIALCCYILSEVAAGLDYAHRRKDHDGKPLGIVHCDVSPQNVALSWEGYVKILDFGVARATFVAAEKGRLRGKPRYMSPEQTRGDIPTPATDVFALGVVAWELLCGAPLFDGPDVESILKAIQRLEVTDPAALNPDIPPALSRAIVRSLSREPAARGLASDLGGAFAQTLRQQDPNLGARSLSRWLQDMFPESPLNAAEPPPVPVSVPVSVNVPMPLPDSEPVSEPSTASASLTPTAPTTTGPGGSTASTASGEPSLPSIEIIEESEPDILDEKRRVVAAALRAEGGGAETRASAVRVLADVAYKHGAVVQSADAGGLVALFGVEVAGDDDVADALRFAAAAHEAAREERLSLRAGVRQGMARRRRGGYALLGDLLDEAGELAAAAAPGRTLFGGVPARLLATGFAFRELPPLRHRGRRMRLHEVLGTRAVEPGARAGGFVGRARELAGLREAWETAVESDAQVACGLLGEAGIGKSRLCGELADRVRAEGGEVLYLTPLPGGRETLYTGVVELLAREVGAPPPRGPGGRARLLGRLRQFLDDAGARNDERDELCDAVGMALELGAGIAPPAEAQANLRERIAFAAGTLRSLREGAPRLLVIDDWHWLDPASAEVFQLLLASPSAGAQLVVVTARPGPEGETPAWPQTVSPVIRLGELSRGEALALIHDRLPAGAAGDDVALIERRAGGNPLFIEELCGAAAEGEMPENARGVIAARVDRLPRGAKAALQYAAVAGPVLQGKLLEELLGPTVGRALVVLEQAGILTRRKGLSVEDGELAFRHGLLQEVVYESLAGAARREAHRRLGTLLSEHYEAGRVKTPETVARHLELGGDTARAAIFWLRAGKLDLAGSGAAAAHHAFSRALELGLGSPERERDALAGREQAAAQLGDGVTRRHDLDALLTLAGDDERRLADVHARRARLELGAGELPAALAAAELAERAAERAGDERGRADALRARAEAHEGLGEPDRALDAAGRALEILRRIGAAGEEAHTLVVAGRVHLGMLALDSALACFRPALDRARAGGDHALERAIVLLVARVHLHRGELGEAVAAAQQALDIARRTGDRAREGEATSFCGAVLAELGRYEEARGWLARALALHEQTGARLSRAETLVAAGRLATLSGDPAAGAVSLEEAVTVAAETGARPPLARAKLELALALCRRRDPQLAGRHAAEATALARASRLVGCEILGLSRQALALLESADARAALTSSTQALRLLDRTGATEGPEEELWFTHHRVLRALGDPSAASAVDHAHAVYRNKLARLRSSEWRQAFDATELHQQIRAAMS